MYDRKKARSLGLTTHCTATTVQPITCNGTYRCTAGHAHSVAWASQNPRLSTTGYDWAFLAALDAADDRAICSGDPGTSAYVEAFNAVLTEHGYASVLLDSRSHTYDH